MKKIDNWIHVIGGLLILLFMYTAFSKWSDMTKFRHQMMAQPFNLKYLPLLIYGLPAIEIICALLIIPAKTRFYGLVGSSILMLLFTGYIILIKTHYYSYIPCSCGGVIEGFNWTQHLFFNLFFLLLAVLGVSMLAKNRNYITEN